MNIVDRVRQKLHRWRVRRRRRKLLSAYAKVGRVRYGLGPGFSPLMYSYDRLTSEGLLVEVDGDLVWMWPDDGGAT